MATHFEPMNLDRPDLFGVRLSGTVSPGDKDRLRELADKCRDNGKVRVILDLSGIGALGGGGAAALADFQRELADADGGAVFVGVGEVMRQFLDKKFKDLPLEYFDSVEDVLAGEPPCEPTSVPPEVDEVAETVAADTAEVEDEPAAEPVAESDPEPAAADAEGNDLEGMLDKVPSNPATNARRKGHQYTSLSDAVAALGGWTGEQDHAEFSAALGNLLYSHGLADETVLLALRDNEFVDPGGERHVPADGGLARIVGEFERPLTLLDIPEQDLDDDDAALLEMLAPDVILPVVQDDELAALVLLKREGDGREYSVAENFALELLMRVLTSRDEPVDPGADVTDEAVPGPDDEPLPEGAAWAPDGTTPAEVLLQLALDLPEAADRPHFWRIFCRHSWPVLPISQLGFLAPERARPQIMAGGNDSWMGMDLGGEKLQLFLSSMERPVAVENMPAFFKKHRDELREAGAEWIIALKWENEHLGNVLLELDPGFRDPDPTELLEELFIETSRLLSRYHDSHDNADVNLELVRILVSQHEKLRQGSDALTATMVKQVGRLARVMAFPPDQERDLVYGCLLRDVGLFDKTEEFPRGDRTWSKEQRQMWRAHPDDGLNLLKDLNVPQTVLDVVKSHHERFDGKGFPLGTEGHGIPLVARVVAIAEHYAEMVTGADGQTPLSPVAAAELLRRSAGSRFDPDLVELFLKAVLPGGARRTAELAELPELEPVG